MRYIVLMIQKLTKLILAQTTAVLIVGTMTAGAGEVGTHLAKMLSHEEHDLDGIVL